jgi:hypothetical protein
MLVFAPHPYVGLHSYFLFISTGSNVTCRVVEIVFHFVVLRLSEHALILLLSTLFALHFYFRTIANVRETLVKSSETPESILRIGTTALSPTRNLLIHCNFTYSPLIRLVIGVCSIITRQKLHCVPLQTP